MTLLIKNGGYTFLIRLDLMLSVIMKIVPIVYKHLVKLILYENDVKLLKFERGPA